MKVLFYISALSSILSVILTVSQWQASLYQARILFIIAIIATGLLTYLWYSHSRMRSKIVPELIHLKGACVVTYELSNIVNRLKQRDFNNNTVQNILVALSHSAAGRVEIISSNYQELIDTYRNLKEPLSNNTEVLRDRFRRAHETVHRLDRARLRKEKLEAIIYHVVEGSDFTE